MNADVSHPVSPSPFSAGCLVERIVSGGQTGVDRAALDWAIDHGVPHGGYCPQGRLAEDGFISPHYRLTESESPEYESRTEQNVLGSDATVVFARTTELFGGSARTADFAVQHGKPFLQIIVSNSDLAARALHSFVHGHDVRVLNVAGPRASDEPDLAPAVQAILSLALLPEQ